MTERIETLPHVKRRLVADLQRTPHTAKLFGACFPLQLEPVIYGVTWKMAECYQGGYWLFYTLDNGGFYMAPSDDRDFGVSCINSWQGVLTADALGITACLYAYSHLSFSDGGKFSQECARQYHLLREYIYDHGEVAAILSAID